MIRDYLIAETRPLALAENTFTKGKVRFTVLSPCLLRVEVSERGTFSDEATQIVWFRDMPKVSFTYIEDLGGVEITTDSAVFYYCKANKKVTYVTIGGKVIPCTNGDNLKGTARTLDMKSGYAPLDNGVIGKNGVAFFEDNSLFLGKGGKLMPRDSGRSDTYVFASPVPRIVLHDYFEITGYPPMVPRYALGNWWCRYHAYTQDEYLTLMKRFKSENIPFSVATVDMDWHWVNIRKQFGWKYFFTRGWTGYSWDKNLFPDYRGFLRELQSMGLKTSLNLHPALGVRNYEDCYKKMCDAVDVDSKEGKTIKFDLTDDKFLNAYFEVLHHPYEDEGVDVWWIDWQQGKKSALAGLDPLWALNHYHTLSAARAGKRPLILSRYAGLGSHRYPLGFSGDTIITWKALKFQPYFTNNAANCGYFDWSHDIGGHTFGDQKDNELYLRWVQYGVFSPILRLHSTKVGVGKEPWNFPEVEDKAAEALRFRMRLVPYIYDAHFKGFSKGIPLCEPLYYRHREEAAFHCPNEYYFGENLLVIPITDKSDKSTKLSTIKAYIPAGEYTDIFTGERIHGGGYLTLTRDLNSIPVFAKDGTVLPLARDVSGSTANPKELELRIYSGNGIYTMYEDDGVTNSYLQGKYAITEFTVSGNDGIVAVTKESTFGDSSVIPEGRSYILNFVNEAGYKVILSQDGKIISPTVSEDGRLAVTEDSPRSRIVAVAYASDDLQEKAVAACLSVPEAVAAPEGADDSIPAMPLAEMPAAPELESVSHEGELEVQAKEFSGDAERDIGSLMDEVTIDVSLSDEAPSAEENIETSNGDEE